MMEMPMIDPHGRVADVLAKAGKIHHERFPLKGHEREPLVREIYWLWMHPLLTVYLFIVLPIAIALTSTA
jgi:hypothetical protein